jgi:hypothetical protein
VADKYLWQDAVARFTLDSATEFMFGKDVCSTAAGLPYPDPESNPHSFNNHPSNTFVRSFDKGQEIAAQRARFGPMWRLLEFWKDEIQPTRKVLNDYVDPILADAIAKKRAGVTEKDEETLLGHLVQFTEGIEGHPSLDKCLTRP